MSDTPIDVSWWLASDGKWYPPSFRPDSTSADSDGGLPPARPKPPTLPPSARATADALAGLPADFHIVHGFGPGSRRHVVNHLVIGPTGVWVVIAAHEPGVLVKQAGTLWNGDTSISTKVEQVETLARFARHLLGCETSSVLCFTTATLPRRAQMVGRVRVLELGVLTDHLAGGHPTLGPDRVAAVLARVDEWLRQAPALSTTPPPPPRGASLRRRIGIGAGIAAAIVTGATLSASFLTDVSVARTESVRPTSTTAPPTTVGVPEELLEVDISCPRLGLGYQLIPRTVSTGLDLLQVAATVDGQPQFIGSLAAGLPGPPIIGVPPSTTVGFDYVVVGTDESTGPPNHVDISTPPWPC